VTFTHEALPAPRLGADTPIIYGGRLAPGVRVDFHFDPVAGTVKCHLDGALHGRMRGQILRRYRSLRHEFLLRAAAATGEPFTVVEGDENGRPADVFRVEPPRAGRA